jgi:3',5'-cyclic AMP phosphodiesterase CpdA
MPLHIIPKRLSRRHFLSSLFSAASAASAVGAAYLAKESRLVAQESLEDDYEPWALLSDTHIAADPMTNARGINMADHLRQAVSELLAHHKQRPFAGALINGDCAFLDGQTEDYRTLGTLVEPLLESGVPLHVTLGNHDERARVQEGLGKGFGGDLAKTSRGRGVEIANLDGKLASRVRGRFCDWYLLDSLEFTNKTPGRVGEAQVAWLADALKAAPTRPALVMVHHNPHPISPAKSNGLTDTDLLLPVLLDNRQVKALFFGHTHVAAKFEMDGLHLVNLPACAYRFATEQPTGWTSALVGPSWCRLTLFDTGKTHALHGREATLKWRT